MRRILLLGASGHGKVVADIVLHMEGMEIVGWLDDDPSRSGTEHAGHRILGCREDLGKNLKSWTVSEGIVTIGDNRTRIELAQWLEANGIKLATAIHPDAQIGIGVEIGSGTVVMAGAVVNSGTTIGRNVIINTGATVDHDCQIEDGVHLAPGSNLCGNVTVGAGTLLSVGSSVVPGIQIGRGTVIGAGSSVIRDVPKEVVAYGTPCEVRGPAGE